MSKRLILLLQILLFIGNLSVSSMPAYPNKIPVKVGDGVVSIQLYGDEHNKRAESLGGYTIIQKGGEWYFAEQDSSGWLKPSVHKLSANISDGTKQFLNGIPKHLVNETKATKSEHRRSTPCHTSRSQNVIGSRKVLVILMQYKDLSMVKDRSDFNALFNGIGYSEDGARGSVCDFYTDVSYGQLQLSCDIIGPFTSKHDRAYYGGNDRSGDDNCPEELFEEAITHAVEQIDLKDYDVDDDGYVDNVHIIFAGHGEEAGAPDEAIWSHEATFYQAYEIQGMKIDRYSCAPELRGNSGKGISRIGPHCHEIGHAMGAMDYYDTDYNTDGAYTGTGNWDVMASGSWNNDGITPADFNPYVKAFDFGWITPKVLPSGDVTISPSCDGAGDYYILKTSYSTDYYLLENRNKEKWGAGIPGEGMLVFHIHPEISVSGNRINAQAPQKCYVVCASSRKQRPENTPSSYGNINSDGCPYPGTSNNTNFGQTSTPVAFFWDDEECGIELNNITIDGDGNIHLENNSISIGSDNIERERLYFEGFENHSVKVKIYKDDESSFLPSWVVEPNPEATKFITKPLAYNGTKSLQLAAKRVSEKITSRFAFNIPEVAEEHTGVLRLKLYVNTLNPQDEKPNSIQIGYQTKDNEEWHYSVIQSSENNQWRQFIIELPNNILTQIEVEGTAYLGSILAIDNLEVEQIIEKNATRIYDLRRKSAYNSTYIFSITGLRLQKKQKGINIVKLADGTFKKIYIK